MEFEFCFLTADAASSAQPETDEPVTTPAGSHPPKETPGAPGDAGASPQSGAEQPEDIVEGETAPGEVVPSPSESGDWHPEDVPQIPADQPVDGTEQTQPKENRPAQSQNPEQTGRSDDSRQPIPSDGTEIAVETKLSGDSSAAEDAFDQERTISGSAVTIAPPREAPEVSPLVPFFGCVLVALLAGIVGAALYRRRRKGAKPLGATAVCSGVVTAASIHELGARDSQQDAWGITGEDAPEQGVLAAVADGMGGLVNSGQVSSALIDGMMEAYAPDGETAPERQLQMLFMQALGRVEKRMEGSTVQSGSTLVACLVKNRQLSWLNVGDSRAYLWRGGGLIQLSRDHDFHHDLTLLAMQGDMELSEADTDPRREGLTSYIGRGFPRKVDWSGEPVQLLSGDKVLLVSDGIYRALSQNEMAECLRADAQQAVQALRALIQKKNHPQQDNYTAVVLEIQ